MGEAGIGAADVADEEGSVAHASISRFWTVGIGDVADLWLLLGRLAAKQTEARARPTTPPTGRPEQFAADSPSSAPSVGVAPARGWSGRRRW